MRGPLVILALLSICGGWIGIERFGGYPCAFSGCWHELGREALDRQSHSWRLILSIVAVLWRWKAG